MFIATPQADRIPTYSFQSPSKSEEARKRKAEKQPLHEAAAAKRFSREELQAAAKFLQYQKKETRRVVFTIPG